MRAATLFSGIGAPETARPDWRWLWSAEIEPFPSAVLAARHPGSVNLGDVTAHDFADRALAIGRPDVLVFGSPCQSFSVAGKRLGLDDPRGNLALVALAVVRRVRPRWLVFENVPGLLSSGGGDDFAAFLAAVQECGYLGCWRVLDARHWGLAQRRQRVFFVGCLGDWRGPAEVLSLAEGLRGYPATGREAGQGVARPLSAGSPGGSGYRNDANTADNLIAFSCKDHGADATAELAPTLRAMPHDGSHANGGGQMAVAYACQGSNVGEAGTLRSGNGHLTGGVPFVAHAFDARQSDVCQYGDIAAPLDTDGHTMAVAVDLQNCALGGEVSGTLDTTSPSRGGGQAVMAFDWQQGGAESNSMRLWDTAGTLAAERVQAVTTAQVRRLTPVECEKLQGFEPGYTAITYRGKPAADGPRYRALGNSMAVPVVRWLLTRIEAVDAALVASEEAA